MSKHNEMIQILVVNKTGHGHVYKGDSLFKKYTGFPRILFSLYGMGSFKL